MCYSTDREDQGRMFATCTGDLKLLHEDEQAQMGLVAQSLFATYELQVLNAWVYNCINDSK